jgi:hypothetical protein
LFVVGRGKKVGGPSSVRFLSEGGPLDDSCFNAPGKGKIGPWGEAFPVGFFGGMMIGCVVENSCQVHYCYKTMDYVRTMDDGLYHRSCWPRLRVPQTERQKILENIKQPARKEGRFSGKWLVLSGMLYLPEHSGQGISLTLLYDIKAPRLQRFLGA